MRKSSIATKLFLAFGGILALAIVAAATGWRGFQRIADTQNVVIDQAIPALRYAHKLADTNALIGSASLNLARASAEDERREISTTLFEHVQALKNLLDDSQAQGVAEAHLRVLRPMAENIATNLRQQSELVRQRLQQEARVENLARQLIETTDELNELADSLVANAGATTTAITSNLYDLVERNATNEQLYDVFDRLVEVDIDGMERMYELRLRSSNLRALINQVTRESDSERLGNLRQLSVETLSILKRRVREINDPQRQRQAYALLDAMELNNGPLYVYGIFESKLALLAINENLQQLTRDNEASSRRLDEIVSELTEAGGSVIGTVSVAAKESLASSRVLFNWSAVLSLLVASVILWAYIKRNVIRRLLSLESATRSIADGRYEVDIDTSGEDEVSRMAGALQIFRDNAIDKRRVDRELLEHKTHLEKLVNQRTGELQEANGRLADVARQHAAARDKAEQANRAKTAFLATMSHELRTPLSGALGTLRLLEDTPLTQDQLEYVRTVNAANATLLDVLNDILGYSQIEAGRLKVESRRFDLGALMNSIVDLMSVAAAEQGCRIVKAFGTDVEVPLYGDSGKLHQILLNLIGNAIKFTNDGTITVSARVESGSRPDARRLYFEVRDTGIGIPADRQEDIFRAFTQVDSSTARRQGGIGLGLAICERLVAALGGQIDLSSEPERGTTIGFGLEMAVPMPLENAGAADATITGAARNVLVVEDDPTNRMVTRRYLEKLGHRVLTADHGERALEILGGESVDLVLMDIGLPGEDGLAVLKRIRKRAAGTNEHVPVIAMSAHVFTEEVEQYMKAGMDGFLGKPFSLNELATALGRAGSGAASVVVGACSDSEAVIDPAVVLEDVERLGLGQVQHMVEMFATSGEKCVEELHHQWEQGDAGAVADVAHKLRGAAGNFGLQRLCARLVETELASRNGAENVAQTCNELRDLFRRSLGELNAVMRQNGLPSTDDQAVSAARDPG